MTASTTASTPQFQSHQRRGTGGSRVSLIALGLTITMMVIEFVAGWLSGSLALIADAWHMLTDASALGLSLFAAWFATRPATPGKTYGYYRTEILAALANGLALWLIVIWIYAQAIHRLQHLPTIDTGPMLVVAVAGLIVNLFIGGLLMKHRAGSLNVQAAWLNVMSDALGSVGVIIAGLCIRWFGWYSADSVASMVIGTLIAFTSWNLVRQAVNVLLEGTPMHLKPGELVEALRTVHGVRAVHDVHLWTITTGMDAMSGHVVIEDINKSSEVLSGLNGVLTQKFHIAHTTLQLEPVQHACKLEKAPASAGGSGAPS